MRTRNTSVLILSALALALGATDDASPASAQPHPARREDTLACLQRAAHETDLLAGQITRLCWATPSPDAPVDCYLAARGSLHLTDPQSVLLCRCADSIAPATCVDSLHHATLLTDPEMISLCSPTIVLRLRADCTPLP